MLQTDVKKKIELAKPQNKDSPSGKRQAELLAEIKQIREKQNIGKQGRNKIQEEIRTGNQKVKELIAQQKVARSRVNFKNVDELDREIDRLLKQVDSGNMKIVDEKKALAEISNLRKQRKGFAGFEESQKQIDETKKKVQDLHDSINDPESKALSERYTVVQNELNGIDKERNEAHENLNGLYNERTVLQKEQQAKYAAVKDIKDEYWKQTRAVQQYEYQSRQRARERKKAENEK